MRFLMTLITSSLMSVGLVTILFYQFWFGLITLALGAVILAIYANSID